MQTENVLVCGKIEHVTVERMQMSESVSVGVSQSVSIGQSVKDMTE